MWLSYNKDKEGKFLTLNREITMFCYVFQQYFGLNSLGRRSSVFSKLDKALISSA